MNFLLLALIGLTFHPVQPTRWIDTRWTECPSISRECPLGPMHDGVNRLYTAKGVIVPSTAKVLAINIVAVDASSRGHLIVFGADRPIHIPLVSTINFQPVNAVANLAFITLGPGDTKDVGIFARVIDGGTVNVVVDVVGYFE